MDIVDRDIDSVRPYEQNPRHNEHAVDAVARSIKKFGWRQPVVVDKDGVIVAGETRWKAGKKLGLKTVPVHVAADLTPELAKAYRIADNRMAELSQWNYDALSSELGDLGKGGFDMSVLGWGDKDLAVMIGDGNDKPPEGGGQEFDESVADGVQKCTCPKCGFVFPK
jgi:ParB-like chromosome segregation protein Spo0J